MTKLESRQNEVWMIFPEDAKRLLAMNYKSNRNISNSTVTKYATDMRNGNWGDTPTPLIITKGGTLLDGQHRLSAVVEAGMPVVFEVRIVPDDYLFKFLDNGKARRIRDYINAPNKTIVSGLATFGYCMKYGRQNIASCFIGRLYDTKNGEKVTSIRADRIGVAKFADDYDEGLESVALLAARMYKASKILGVKTYGATLLVIRMLDDVDLTNEFVDEFCKTAPDSKSVYAGKAALLKMASGKVNPRRDMAIGMLLDIYKKFVDCTGATRFTSWEKTLKEYDEKLNEMRVKT